jgi:hypothetical protein
MTYSGSCRDDIVLLIQRPLDVSISATKDVVYDVLVAGTRVSAR